MSSQTYDKTIFTRRESEARSYCRSFDAVFTSAVGSEMTDDSGRTYIDFLAGCSSLNYGHNDPDMKAALVEHLSENGIAHGLDMYTGPKARFFETFEDLILKPRGMDHKIMMTGPTGTNAVEAAMKLARKVTGREQVVGFTNAFHGMTIGSLAVSGNGAKRLGAGVALTSGTSVPYDGYFGDEVDTISYLDALMADSGSGFEKPAAVIVETVQAEGGINAASAQWLRRLRELCTTHDVLLIVDDIQAGCGRTGSFFSFEFADIEPDIITLSKSLSGFGLPFAITTFRRDLDIFDPGEHNGTFRGSNPAFVTATAALSRWDDDRLERSTAEKAAVVAATLDGLVEAYPEHALERRGRGLLQGVECVDGLAVEVAKHAFGLGLIVETSGVNDEVLKLLPALTIGAEELAEGLELLTKSFAAVVGARSLVSVG